MGKHYDNDEVELREFTATMKSFKRLEKQHMLPYVSDETLWKCIRNNPQTVSWYLNGNNYEPFEDRRRYERVAFYYTMKTWKLVFRWIDEKRRDAAVGEAIEANSPQWGI